MDIDKFENFSEWFDTIIKEGELADLRYNLKGFVVYRPWSVLAMRKMFLDFEEKLMERGHQPTIFPALIPERNFEIEKEHVAGFTPEVFWVTEHGNKEKLESSILELYNTLDDEVAVFPGHGNFTTIGYEKKNNPFIKLS